MPKSTFYANTLVNLLRSVAYTPPANVFVALYTTVPTSTTSGTEVSGGSYTRQPLILSPSSGGSASNTVEIVFPTATSTWGTVVAYAITDALSGGNVLYYAPFLASRDVLVGDTMRFPVGQLIVTES